MAANNNNGGPAWYPEYEPSLSPRTNDWMRLFTDNVYSLRASAAGLNETIQNVNSNVTQRITAIQANLNAATNNSNGSGQKPVIFGTHANRVGNFAPAAYTGFLFTETDRFQTTYYSNGSAWILVTGIATGAFEFRYTGLNAYDQGLIWIETSRNNVSGTPPYVTYQWSGAQWNYQWGEFYRPQNGVSTLAGTFNSANANYGNDFGAIVNVTDFAGQLQWQNNNTWYWGPRDDGSHGDMRWRESDPTGAWWQLYDGSNNVTFLQSNGNLGSANLLNLSGSNAGNTAFLEAGEINSGINPAVSPVFTGNAATGNLNTTSANFTTGITPAITSVSFTGANVTGNISNNGQPPSVVRRAWFRR